jgi:Protein of unknown function (DUF2934)
MSEDKQTRIEQRAYALWQMEGRPDGRHEEHWQRAAREIEAEETADAAVSRTAQRIRRSSANSGRRSPRRAKKASA